MSNSPVLVEIHEGVATATLNRPEAANTVTAELARALRDIAVRCSQDNAVRAVLLRANGRMFCGGGDLKSFVAQDDVAAYLKQTTTDLHAAISYFTRMKAPLVGAVQGFAAGGGFSLTMACDLVVAGEGARFKMAYTQTGLTPDGSSTYFLPRLIGLRRALDLALTNRTLSAAEALDWGLISRVVPDERLDEEAAGLAARLASGPLEAFGATKRLLQMGSREGLESQMAEESLAIAAAAEGPEGSEGMAAFVEKRAPEFR